MYGDFSRLTFRPVKHFSAVLHQQGRLQLDADANEQTAIAQDYLRTFVSDLIGPYAGPRDDNGFEIETVTTQGKADFKIGAGHYYVDGIRCDATPPSRATKAGGYRYQYQLDVPYDPDDDKTGLPAGKAYLVYLKVSERLVTAIEDAEIRELALGLGAVQRANTTRQPSTILVNRARPTCCNAYDHGGDFSVRGGPGQLIPSPRSIRC
ncbi:MAG: DUF6519 domain-containing protein [Pseudonocardiaceae bacterium]